MLTMAKFLLGCICIGALAFLGASLVQNGPQAVMQNASMAVRRTAFVVPGSLESICDSADSSVRRNLTTVELKLDFWERHPVKFNLSDWLPSGSSHAEDQRSAQPTAHAEKNLRPRGKKTHKPVGVVTEPSRDIAVAGVTLNRAAVGFYSVSNQANSVAEEAAQTLSDPVH